MTARVREALVGTGLGLAVTLAVLPAVTPVYGPGAWGPVLGAALLAALANLVVRVAVPRGAVAVLVPVGLLGALLWTASVVRPALDGATAIGGLRDGVARLLTTLPPVDARGPELAVAVVAVWLAAALATGIASRDRPGILLAAPPVALFVAALALGDARHALADHVPLVVVVVLGAGLVALSFARGRARPVATVEGHGPTAARRAVVPVVRVVAGGVVVALAAGLGHVVAPKLPGAGDRPRLDLRGRQHPPVDVLAAENPLDVVPARVRARPSTTRFTATVRLPADADRTLRWRLVVLDRLTPTGWQRSATRFVRAGRDVGAPPADEAGGRALATATIRLGTPVPDVPLLPTLDRPVGVAPSGLAFATATGELAVPAGDAPPRTLTERVALPVLTGTDLRTATITPDLALAGDVPPSVGAVARATAGPGGSPLRRLSLWKRSLEQSRSLRLDAGRTGRTAPAAVAELLQPPAGGGARRVNAAQLASAFALLARSQGLPVRVVVGYATPTGGSRTATVRATDRQLTVWSEVRFDRLGWVPFPISAPIGGRTGGTPPPAQRSTSVIDQTADQETKAADEEATRRRTTDPGPTPTRRATPDQGVAPWLVALLVALALAVLVLASGPLVRARRRRTRRRGPPEAQVLGAWAELVDRGRAAGLPLAEDRTRPEVVAVVVRDAEPLLDLAADLAWLAGTADGVAFAAGVPVGEDGARRAWSTADRVAALARARQPRAERLVADLRPPVGAGHR